MGATVIESGNLQVRQKIARGTLWNFVGIAGDQAISMTSFVVVARVLGPVEMGIAVLATAVIDVLVTLVRSGVPESIVRNPDPTSIFMNTAAWANLMVGTILMVTVMAASGPIADIYGVPKVQDLLLVLALIFPISAYSSVCESVLVRRLAFDKVAKRVLLGSILGASASIALVLTQFGVWALVAQRLVVFSVGCIITATASGFVPSFGFDRSEMRKIATYASGVTFTTTLHKLQPRFSELLIGVFLYPQAVAMYRVASRLVDLMAQLVAQPISRFAFPILSRHQDDMAKFRTILLSVGQIASSLVIPLFLYLMYFSPRIFHVLLGSKWDGAPPVFVLLSLAVVLRTSFALYPLASSARGRVGRVAVLVFAEMLLSLVALALAARLGIEAVALSRVLVCIAFTPILMRALVRDQGIGYVQFLRNAAVPYLVAGVVLASLLLADLLSELLGISRFSFLVAMPFAVAGHLGALSICGRGMLRQVALFGRGVLPQIILRVLSTLAGERK